MVYVRLLRVKHYLKNILILIPFIFGHKLYDVRSYPVLLSGFFVFSMICSVVYIINDLKDIELDRKHPVKCRRPLAAGQVSVKEAYLICSVLFVLSACIYTYLWFHVEHKIVSLSLLILVTYLVLNMWYSIGGGKEIPIVDIIILVSGFLIRVVFGSILTNVKISGWLYLVVITISFYMALGKRRNELKKHHNQNTRGVLAFYNMGFLDKNMYVCQTLAIAFYALWTVDAEVMSESANGKWAIWTVPLVIIMAMKYSLDIEGESEGDPIEVILGDKMLIAAGVVYVFIMYFIIYGI
jgi:decaprenyl-phosphate phosphoribosyltransferase